MIASLLAVVIVSFCCVWPNKHIGTSDDNAICIFWLQSGHAGKVEHIIMLRMRSRAMSVANIRENHESITSELNTLMMARGISLSAHSSRL